jgi:hypothetical protein
MVFPSCLVTQRKLRRSSTRSEKSLISAPFPDQLRLRIRNTDEQSAGPWDLNEKRSSVLSVQTTKKELIRWGYSTLQLRFYTKIPAMNQTKSSTIKLGFRPIPIAKLIAQNFRKFNLNLYIHFEKERLSCRLLEYAINKEIHSKLLSLMLCQVKQIYFKNFFRPQDFDHLPPVSPRYSVTQNSRGLEHMLTLEHITIKIESFEDIQLFFAKYVDDSRNTYRFELQN